MIKKFQNFNEELDPKTYIQAHSALKRRSLGRDDSKHFKRSKELKSYADKLIIKEQDRIKEELIKPVKHIGPFSFNFYLGRLKTNAWTSTIGDSIPIEQTFWKVLYSSQGSGNFNHTLKGPLDAYITKIDFDFIEEEFCEEIELRFYATPTNELCYDTKFVFSVKVPILWHSDGDDETFEISSSKSYGDNLPAQFLKREDVNRFRKFYLNKDMILQLMSKESYSRLREFFMMYSNHDELEKFFKVINNITVNDFYY